MGGPAPSHGRGNHLPAHTARSASCETAVAFPSLPKMLSTGRSSSWGSPRCHSAEPPWFGGRVTLPRGEMLPPVTEAEIQREAGAAPEPTRLSPGAALCGAGRRGRKQLAAACRAQEGPAQLSPLFPRPGGNHRGGCRAGLGSLTAEGQRSLQHPPVTGLCPAPATPHGHLEGSGLALGSCASNPVPKPTARPGPRATGGAQPGRGHRCTPSKSLHTRRDKDGHGDGELTPLTSQAASPALPPALLGGVGHPPKENPPFHHELGTVSQVLTHRWSCSMSSTTSSKNKTAPSPSSTSPEDQLCALPVPVQDLAILQSVSCESDPSRLISPAQIRMSRSIFWDLHVLADVWSCPLQREQ